MIVPQQQLAKLEYSYTLYKKNYYQNRTMNSTVQTVGKVAETT